MQTECNSQRILFQELGHREVVADFQGGNITSDVGDLLLGDINRGKRVIEHFTCCFTDFRRFVIQGRYGHPGRASGISVKSRVSRSIICL